MTAMDMGFVIILTILGIVAVGGLLVKFLPIALKLLGFVLLVLVLGGIAKLIAFVIGTTASIIVIVLIIIILAIFFGR